MMTYPTETILVDFIDYPDFFKATALWKESQLPEHSSYIMIKEQVRYKQ
jgi:hypothetical protein